MFSAFSISLIRFDILESKAFIADRKIVSKLLIKDSFKKITEVDNHIAIAGAGVMSDGRRRDLELESKRSVSSLQDAASLVQRLKAVGGDGFAIDQPQPRLAPLEEHDDESVSPQASTMSYLKSFGEAITSPMKYFGGNHGRKKTRWQSTGFLVEVRA